MLKASFMAAALVGIAGLAAPAFAQETGTVTTSEYTSPDGSRTTVVTQRVMDDGSTVIERREIIGPLGYIPPRNTGISRVNGAVGGAIGGYYINGTTPADNLPLNLSPLADAYQH